MMKAGQLIGRLIGSGLLLIPGRIKGIPKLEVYKFENLHIHWLNELQDVEYTIGFGVFWVGFQTGQAFDGELPLFTSAYDKIPPEGEFMSLRRTIRGRRLRKEIFKNELGSLHVLEDSNLLAQFIPELLIGIGVGSAVIPSIIEDLNAKLLAD